METKTKQFVEYFKKINNEKENLISLLGAEEDRAFAYYIAPIDNINNIRQCGGILPRRHVNDFVDVSSQPIQELRDRTVFFSDSSRNIQVKLHDCVNLFLNPINDTLYQFRRNALIRSNAGREFSPIIGILEIDLESLLFEHGIYWNEYPYNFVKSRQNIKHDYRKFDWDKIFTLTVKTNRNKNQSAEIIIYNSTDNITISSNKINRVILLEDDIPNESFEIRNNIGFQADIVTNHHNYSALNDRLHYDRKFLQNFYLITSQGKNADSIINSLIRISNIEDEIGLSLIKDYQIKNVAKDIKHGIPHTIRVMFWVLFLASEVNRNDNWNIEENDITAALYAAFIHDLCRLSNQVDQNHGCKSANKFKEHLSNYFEKPYLQKCLFAVKVHSEKEDPQITNKDTDIIWVLLKDADAIDRSRFAAPGKADSCQKKFLRLKILTDKSDFTNNLLWGAYYFARATNYIPYHVNACFDFVDMFNSILLTLSNSPDTSDAHRAFANNIVLHVNAEL